MFCTNCGTRLDDAAKFCPDCGTSTELLAVATDEIQKETQSSQSSQTTPQINVPQPAKEQANSSSKKFVWIAVFIAVFLAIFIGISNKGGLSDQTISGFKESEVGKALLACVASTGDISFKPLELEKAGKGVEVNLKKNNKDVLMQFSYRADPKQINLVGAQIKGEDKLNKFALMLSLELMCGGPTASRILPDDYQSLRQMQGIQNMFK